MARQIWRLIFYGYTRRVSSRDDISLLKIVKKNKIKVMDLVDLGCVITSKDKCTKYKLIVYLNKHLISIHNQMNKFQS